MSQSKEIIENIKSGGMGEDTLRAILLMLGKEGREELERLAWENKDTDITYQGDKIILPAEPTPMAIRAAIEALERKEEEENTEFELCEQIKGFPFDAAVAFVKAMKETYGWASVIPARSFWDVMPEMHTVRVGAKPKDTIQVPMGRFKIPGVANEIWVHISNDHEGGTRMRPVLCIHATVKLREKRLIMDLVAKTKEIMARESIYKGRALRLKVEPNGEINFGLEPHFIDVSRINPDELVLSKDVQEEVDVSLLTPIRETAHCLEIKIPLKRGVLLAGEFGTGKTLTASVVARICEEHGWTFISVDDVKGLKDAIEFAKHYEPAVVSAEDVDRVTGARTDKVNDLLNMVDGILTKESKVITVLTTNHVDKINQAMLRPGRLDAVIMVTPPDAEAAQRLIRMYGRGLIAVNEPLEEIGAMIAGRIPAIIREVVERSKLSMVRHKRSQVIEADLLTAARGMKPHLDLLSAPAEQPKSPAQRAGEALGDLIAAQVGTGDDSRVMRTMIDGHDKILGNIAHVGRHIEQVQSYASGLPDMRSDIGDVKSVVVFDEEPSSVRRKRLVDKKARARDRHNSRD